jgi:hypothetical protein
VLLVPAHAIVLVPGSAENLDDLAATRWLARWSMDLQPVACAPPGFGFDGHGLTF